MSFGLADVILFEARHREAVNLGVFTLVCTGFDESGPQRQYHYILSNGGHKLAFSHREGYKFDAEVLEGFMNSFYGGTK